MKTDDGTPELPNQEEFVKEMISSTIEEWVNIAYATTLSGLTRTSNPKTMIEEMRWLHLAQPYLVANDIYALLKMAGALKRD